MNDKDKDKIIKERERIIKEKTIVKK